MAKTFPRVTFTENDLSEILSANLGLEQIVYIEADRGPHLQPIRLRTVAALRKTFGPRPTGDLVYLATESALDKGATLHVTRLLFLSDPTDIATIDAVAAEIDVADQAGAPTADAFTFFINELGIGGNGWSVITAAGTLANTVKVTLQSTETGIEDEVYDDLSVDSDDARFISTILNTNNAGRLRVTVKVPTASPSFPDDLPAFLTSVLGSGSNGTALNAASIIGDATAGTGLHGANKALGNPNVMAGHQVLSSDNTVVSAMGSYGQAGDIVMFFQPPNPGDTADSIDFRNGDGIYSHAAFDNSFLVGVYSRHLVFDVAQGVEVLQPCFGELAPSLVRAFERNRGGAFWLAPAGRKRGGVTSSVLDLEDNVGEGPRAEEADDLVGASYNPYVFSDGSIKFWGNFTMLLDETKLTNRLAVRFLLIGLRRILRVPVELSQFDPNRTVSWMALALRATPIMEGLQADGAFNKFRWDGDQNVVDPSELDETNVNNATDVAAGKYLVDIPIQPYSAIDQEIGVRMNITSTAVIFEEFFIEA